MNVWILWMIGIGLGLAPAHGPQGPSAPAVREAGSEQDAARAAMRKADELRRAVRGRGEERRASMERAAAAYEAVVREHAGAKEEVATAAFRAAEMKRLLGKPDEARVLFAKVVASGGSRRLGARAIVETAHLYRRAKEFGKALESYRRAAVEFADETATRDDALFWVGVLLEQSKEYGKSREAWQAVAERGIDPMDRIRAYDRIALSHLKEGSRPEAESALERARTSLHDIASDPSARGARIRRALERMRSARALEGESEPTAKGEASSGAPKNDADDEDDG